VIASRKPFRKEGLGYVYEPTIGEGQRLGVVLKMDSIHRRGDSVVGQLVVETCIPGYNPHLVETVQNISGVEARGKLAKLLDIRTKAAALDWDTIIESFCVAVLRAERQGTPIIQIGNLPDEKEPPDVIQHLVQLGRINEVHGPGGDGKGWLSSFIAVCHTTGHDLAHLRSGDAGRVLYLDWEDDGRTLNRRIKAACRGMGLEPTTIDYMQCHGALKDQVLQIARHVATSHTTLLVTDSVELACGVGSEHGTYEERAHGLHSALRAIATSVDWDVSTWLIDHVSEEARRNEKGVNKAYGSGAKQWWARNTWELRKDQPPGSPIATLGLFPFKANHSGAIPPIGLALDFSRWPEAVSIARSEVHENDALARKLTNGTRILAVMGSGPQFVGDIAEQCDLTQDVTRTEMNRLAKKGVVVKTTDGRWVKTGRVPEGPPATTPEEAPDLYDPIDIPF
jgi:hypothetical protein